MDSIHTRKQTMQQKNKTAAKPLNVRRMVTSAMLGAVAVVLMLFEVPLWFAPSFYEIDFSEVPVVIGAFAFGPMAGVLTELVKILLNFVINGTKTAGVGELANFIMGCSFVLPAAFIYQKRKTKKNAFLGLAAGTISLVVVGCFMNLYVLLPAYAKAFGIGVDGLIAAGAALNASVTNLSSFVLLCVAPFNLLKGILISFLTILLYKKISVILKANQEI